MLELVKSFVQIMLRGYSVIEAREVLKGSWDDVETQACGVKSKAGEANSVLMRLVALSLCHWLGSIKFGRYVALL